MGSLATREERLAPPRDAPREVRGRPGSLWVALEHRADPLDASSELEAIKSDPLGARSGRHHVLPAPRDGPKGPGRLGKDALLLAVETQEVATYRGTLIPRCLGTSSGTLAASRVSLGTPTPRGRSVRRYLGVPSVSLAASSVSLGARAYRGMSIRRCAASTRDAVGAACVCLGVPSVCLGVRSYRGMSVPRCAGISSVRLGVPSDTLGICRRRTP